MRPIRMLIHVVLALLVTAGVAVAEMPGSHEAYRVGPNDVLRIIVFGEDDLTVERKVEGDGKIEYPLLGTIRVGGRTIEEIQALLTAQLAADYVQRPQVSVSIARHRNFYVGGEVKTPGGYAYEEGLSVQKAIAMAGGFTEKSDKAGIKVTRFNGKELESLSLGPDTLVMPDDLIYVAPVNKIYVTGEVRRPGDYPYEKDLTIHKAITMAGGFTDKAAEGSTKVLRKINGKERTLEVSLDAVVQPNDIIVVPQGFF